MTVVTRLDDMAAVYIHSLLAAQRVADSGYSLCSQSTHRHTRIVSTQLTRTCTRMPKRLMWATSEARPASL